MSDTKDINVLPFDQVSRQRIVRDCIDKLRANNKEPFAILDAGGHKGLTVSLQPKDEVTILDVYDEKYDGYVMGDACNMTFSDNSFDFVVSFDVLEHIPKKDRPNFLKECARVAKRGVFIAAPNATTFNETTEKSLNDLYIKLHNKEHEWLSEHIEYGLPNHSEVVSNFSKHGMHTLITGSNSSELWFYMQGAILNATKFGDALGPLAELNVAYNKQLYYDGEYVAENNYRMICIALKSKKDYAILKKHISQLTHIDNAKKTSIMSAINSYYSKTLDIMNEKIFKQQKELEKADSDIRTCLGVISDLEHKVNEKDKTILTRFRSKLATIKNRPNR